MRAFPGPVWSDGRPGSQPTVPTSLYTPPRTPLGELRWRDGGSPVRLPGEPRWGIPPAHRHLCRAASGLSPRRRLAPSAHADGGAPWGSQGWGSQGWGLANPTGHFRRQVRAVAFSTQWEPPTSIQRRSARKLGFFGPRLCDGFRVCVSAELRAFPASLLRTCLSAFRNPLSSWERGCAVARGEIARASSQPRPGMDARPASRPTSQVRISGPRTGWHHEEVLRSGSLESEGRPSGLRARGRRQHRESTRRVDGERCGTWSRCPRPFPGRRFASRIL